MIEREEPSSKYQAEDPSASVVQQQGPPSKGHFIKDTTCDGKRGHREAATGANEGASSASGVSSASKVLHVRNIAPATTEEDLQKLVMPFGRPEMIKILSQKNQMESVEAAQKCVAYHKEFGPLVRRRRVFVQFSNYTELSDTPNKLSSLPPNRVLLLTGPELRLSPSELAGFLSRFGSVEKVLIPAASSSSTSSQAFVQFATLEAANEARQQLSSGSVTLPSTDPSNPRFTTSLRVNAHFSKMKELVHKGHALYWDHHGATGRERGTRAAPPQDSAHDPASPSKRPLPDSRPTTTAAGAPLHGPSCPATLPTAVSPFPSPLTAFPLAPPPFPSPLPPSSSGTSTPTFSRAVGGPRHSASTCGLPPSPLTSAGAVGHRGSFLESQGSPHWSGLRGVLNPPPSPYFPTTGDPGHSKSTHLPSPLIPPNGHFSTAPTPTGHVTSPYHDATPPPLLAYPSSHPPGSALSPYPSPYLLHPSPYPPPPDTQRWALSSDAPLPSPPAAAAPDSHSHSHNEFAHLEGFPLDDLDDTPHADTNNFSTSSQHQQEQQQQRQARQGKPRRGDAASIDAAAVPSSQPPQRKPSSSSARAPPVPPVEPKGVVLLVTGLDPTLTTCDGLCALFSNYGEVVRCRRLLHKPDHALVEMHDASAAANAVNFLRGSTLFNKPIKVSFSKHAHIFSRASQRDGDQTGGKSEGDEGSAALSTGAHLEPQPEASASPRREADRGGRSRAGRSTGGDTPAVGPADAAEDDRYFQEYGQQSRRRAVLKHLRSVTGPSSVLYLSHLPRHVSMEVLYEHMKQFGDVKNMKIFESSGRTQSLVEFADVHAACTALVLCHGSRVQGKGSAIHAAFSKNKFPTPPPVLLSTGAPPPPVYDD